MTFGSALKAVELKGKMDGVFQKQDESPRYMNFINNVFGNTQSNDFEEIEEDEQVVDV